MVFEKSQSVNLNGNTQAAAAGHLNAHKIKDIHPTSLPNHNPDYHIDPAQFTDLSQQCETHA